MIMIIDGQGGRVGRELTKRVLEQQRDDIYVFGTNAIATDRMLKVGAKKGATGSDAIALYAGKADFIMGPLGIVIPGGLLGEINGRVAEAVSTSNATKILIPFAHEEFRVAGIKEQSLKEAIEEAVEILMEAL